MAPHKPPQVKVVVQLFRLGPSHPQIQRRTLCLADEGLFLNAVDTWSRRAVVLVVFCLLLYPLLPDNYRIWYLHLGSWALRIVSLGVQQDKR